MTEIDDLRAGLDEVEASDDLRAAVAAAFAVPEHLIGAGEWELDAPIGYHGIRDRHGYPIGGVCRLGCGCDLVAEIRAGVASPIQSRGPGLL